MADRLEPDPLTRLEALVVDARARAARGREQIKQTWEAVERGHHAVGMSLQAITVSRGLAEKRRDHGDRSPQPDVAGNSRDGADA
jgi:hypothetical protein